MGEDLISSPYRSRFWQGATIVPRVRSQRSSTEKKPWKDLPDREGVVEAQFVAGAPEQ
ncbi:hypothetical protein ACWEAF_44520 [Streptomyces sp. NPDC005071]|uniref:hypothetical protein n=1 Tax=Streptomyces sp. 900116325 TaxID=3154295 RepID=UPI0033B21C3C